MKTIVIACEKGGVGKSTLAANLAISFSKTASIGLVDADSQNSIVGWSNRRDSENNFPVIPLDPRHIAKAKTAGQDDGFDYLFIDTAPTRHISELQPAFEAADLIIIPVPPSFVDLEPALKTVKVAKQFGKKSAVVLTKVRPKRGVAQHWRVIEAQKQLAPLIKIAPATIGLREAFSTAFDHGQGVIEHEPNGRAANEILALANWIYEEIK